MLRLDVINDGTGTKEKGNYRVEMILPEMILPDRIYRGWQRIEANILNWPRERPWSELMRAAVDAACLAEKMLHSSAEGGT